MLFVAAVLALVIGLSLGLLGGGGSILTLPILVYVLHVDAKEAIAASLFVVGTTALVSAVSHARANNVQYRTGALFGAASMTGAFAGGKVAGSLPGNVLLGAFAVMMLVTSLAMMRPRKEPAEGETHTLSIGRVLAVGAGVGLVAGLVGAGGGFLIVPALVLFGGLDMRRAIGTSLMVLTLQSFAGFAGHVTHTHVDWTLTGIITASAVMGSLVGARLAKRLSVATLRRGFAWFVLAMAVFMIGKQFSPLAAAITGVVAVVIVLVASRLSAAKPQVSSKILSNTKVEQSA
ncbi:MAG: sulfite exporter TauE/SafE family protein [Polyangiaceae bacterium]